MHPNNVVAGQAVRRLQAEAERAPFGDEQVTLPAEIVRRAEGESVGGDTLLKVGERAERILLAG